MFNFWKKKKTKTEEIKPIIQKTSPTPQDNLSLSLQSVINSMSQEDINEINEALSKQNPVEYEKRDKTLDTLLGFDKEVTTYEGSEYNQAGLTKWVDTRDGKEYSFNSIIDYEILGSKKIKWYWMKFLYNGEEFSSRGMNQHEHEKLTKEEFFRKQHEFTKVLSFSRIKRALTKNPEYTPHDYFLEEIAERKERDLN